MNPLALPTNSASSDWLVFLSILLAVGFGIACFVFWFFQIRNTGKKKKRKHRRRHRQTNPTLDQNGGLPPARPPGVPPKGV
jgi:hypothetical protein